MSSFPSPYSRRLPSGAVYRSTHARLRPRTIRNRPAPSACLPSAKRPHSSGRQCGRSSLPRLRIFAIAIPRPSPAKVTELMIALKSHWEQAGPTNYMAAIKKAPVTGLLGISGNRRESIAWRRRRDSNPGYRFWPVCSLSRGVPSTTRPRLREAWNCSGAGAIPSNETATKFPKKPALTLASAACPARTRDAARARRARGTSRRSPRRS